ncbi:phenylacetate--CoA ligase family protein [Aurantimonas sp. NFXS3]|uniref:phenylacetate--CoA ligase family protein n=1 Tax=Aurantimonas sp. NFXS3 TaxID=2818434 RepID=UPI003BA392C4
MMHEPEIETLPWQEQHRQDDALYRQQIGYLLEHSRFYQKKLQDAGFETAGQVGGLDDLAALPLTEKDELRATRSEADPIGTHLAASMQDLARIYSTSGTTGTPSYIPLTAADLDNWVRTSARSYAASGITPHERIVTTYNAGPFVAGAALDSFNRLGLCHVPVGTGNTERLMAAVNLLKPQALACTPSYALYLAEWGTARGMDLPTNSVKRILVAGEPGGGEPAMRSQLESAWGAKVTEAMGIGDIGASLWGECEEQTGMHFCARGFVHIELIDPHTGEAVAMEDGASGELVYTHLAHRGAPMLRFRSRDHVTVRTEPCRCGRTSPRVRCIGRTDDMLIVRGVNVFPSAIREVVNEFAPAVTGVISVRPGHKGVKQTPPLKVLVELAADGQEPDGLADRIRQRLRDKLVVATDIALVAAGNLPRSEYKSKLIDYSEVQE